MKSNLGPLLAALGGFIFFSFKMHQATKKGKAEAVNAIEAQSAKATIARIEESQKNQAEVRKEHEEINDKLPIDWPDDDSPIWVHQENSSLAEQDSSTGVPVKRRKSVGKSK